MASTPPELSPPADAIKTASTLATKVLTSGTGTEHPTADSIVTVKYEMWSSDGALIDGSAMRGDTPTTWLVGRIARTIHGLGEGIQLMVVGEKRRLWIPPSIGYARPDRPAAGLLIFDVELIAVTPSDTPGANEFAAAPPGAMRTASGLAYKILRAGSGAARPQALSTVTIAYTGWLTNGEAFDNGVGRGEPLSVAVDTLMPGLAEALQRMVVGEKTRFWVPEALAYTPPGPPKSALLFDVELLAIQRAMDGPPGTVEVRINSPDAQYIVVQPDGTPLKQKGPTTFRNVAPGRYRIKPAAIRNYTIGIVAAPSDMVLAPGGTMTITVSYVPIVQ